MVFCGLWAVLEIVALGVAQKFAPFPELALGVELAAAKNEMPVEGFVVPIVGMSAVPAAVLRGFGFTPG
ncbi:hypothetical protein J6A32_06565 [Methanocorpusculum sp.]|nr:hypothetical protein [Methanocorpusculum sp.]